MTAPDPRLDEIQARLDAATPGPWEVDGIDSGHSRFAMSYWVTAGNGDQVCDMDGLVRSGNESVAKDDGGADSWFIANAPTDVAFLLAELRKAHEALEAVEEFASLLDAAGSDDEPLYAKGKVSARASAAQLRAAVAAANGDGNG